MDLKNGWMSDLSEYGIYSIFVFESESDEGKCTTCVCVCDTKKWATNILIIW